MSDIVPVASNADAYRSSTDAAGLCREIVVKTAKAIQGRKYVGVEGWMAVAVAHGCAASALDVERVPDEGMSGFKCVGVVRRMSDGQEIARAEGFLGDDEQTWSKRPVYARRAMVQTRAISRACRSAFAHVVVMIDAGLSTTPAEEVPAGGFDDGNVIENKPQPRQKLEGPHSSKTALQKAVGELRNAARAADTLEGLNALLKGGKPTIGQATEQWPSLIDGDPNIPEDIGLKGDVEKRREELANSGPVAALIASMQECEDMSALAKWREANSREVEALDGADVRRYEKAWDELTDTLPRNYYEGDPGSIKGFDPPREDADA